LLLLAVADPAVTLLVVVVQVDLGLLLQVNYLEPVQVLSQS
jgi:hypothetical protein